jgi:hypothetical protein
MWREERRELEKTWRQGLTEHKEAKARDNLTILSLVSRSGEVVTSRTFHRLSFDIVGALMGVSASAIDGLAL